MLKLLYIYIDKVERKGNILFLQYTINALLINNNTNNINIIIIFKKTI